MKKGVLADLAPGLDAMGITDKEYFPAVRALRMGDEVYGIHTHIFLYGYSIRELVLGGRGQPDIETLFEKLYAFTEQGRNMPLRTKEILNIIYEETQTFCDGDKPLEEVCNVIQRRVQIYISETM